MSIKLKNKEKFKKDIYELLSSIIIIPNEDVLNVRADFDPNLQVVTLKYYSYKESKDIVIFDEKI